MKKIFALCALSSILFFSACREAPLSVIEMKCGDTDVLAEVYKNRLEAIVGDKSLTLHNLVAESGIKYGGEFVVLWNRGENWMMITDEDTDAEKMFDCI